MRQEILYNGIELFSGQQIPFVSKGVEYVQAGERWCQIESWNLNGSITGCSFEEINDRKISLVSNLNVLIGSGLDIGTGISLSPVYLNEVSFEDSEYIGILPYSITFTHYPSGFSEFYGVLDPSDQISYVEETDQTMSISRTVSARGYCTDGANSADSALSNAKNFVNQRLLISPMSPFIIDTSNTDLSSYLISSTEELDRINQTYSITQTYRNDLQSAEGSIINRYTRTEQKRTSERTVISIRGQIDGGRYHDQGITGLRQKYLSFRNSIATPYFSSENVTEDKFINRITYDFSFYLDESGKDPQFLDDYTVNLSENSDSSLVYASIDGNITYNWGCLDGGWDGIKQLFADVTASNFHMPFIKEIYEIFHDEKPAGVDLNQDSITYSSSQDENNKTISYNLSIDDRSTQNIPQTKSFNPSLQINLPVEKKAIKENYVGGYYICQKLGYNERGEVSVSIERESKDSSSQYNQIKTYAESLRNQFASSDRTYDGPINRSLSEESKTESVSCSRTYNTNTPFEL